MLRFVSPSLFARQVGINRKTILQAIRSNQLPAVRVGQRYRIELNAAAEWARGQLVMPGRPEALSDTVSSH
jgi:excisionase family DNA binding protein